jgi:hypothetical protein
LRWGVRREIFSAKEAEVEVGVRKVTGVRDSLVMVARRPKCVSVPTRVLKSDRSSLEAWGALARWRCEGIGWAYQRFRTASSRVLYLTHTIDV